MLEESQFSRHGAAGAVRHWAEHFEGGAHVRGCCCRCVFVFLHLLFCWLHLPWLSCLRCRYRLLCAEREDKKGDEWSKEMQAMRQHAL